MYRTTYSKSFRYKCGLYQQSHGARCDHNHVDGPTAARFILSCIRQHVLSPKRLEMFTRSIKELASADQDNPQINHQLREMQHHLAKVETEQELVVQNLARAGTDEQYRAVSEVYDQLNERCESLRAEIATVESRAAQADDVGADSVEMAMEVVRRLPELVGDGNDLKSAKEIFELLNARLFLRFEKVQVKKRKLNKLNGGVVTFGNAPAPINIYQGPTARTKVKDAIVTPLEEQAADGAKLPQDRGPEEKSLGNVNRGDWI
jgi:hypothetical protein